MTSHSMGQPPGSGPRRPADTGRSPGVGGPARGFGPQPGPQPGQHPGFGQGEVAGGRSPWGADENDNDAGTGGPGPDNSADPDKTGGPGDSAGPDTTTVTEDPLAVATRQRDEYLDMVRRVQADFENYKKRTQRQQTEQVDRASESLVAKLLPALDAFDLTRAHLTAADEASPHVKALLAASGLVADALAKEGLERVDDAGAPFDPTMHDAVEHAPAADEVAPGTGSAGPVVAEVLRPGYRWKGRVIRPAMVRVRG